MKKKRGQSIVEYALLLGCIAVAGIVALGLTGHHVSNIFGIASKSFNEKTIEPQGIQYEVAIGEYKIDNKYLLGFDVEERVEEYYGNISVFLVTSTGEVEMQKGMGLSCPANTYCLAQPHDYIVADLIEQGAFYSIRSNNEEVLTTPVWDW